MGNNGVNIANQLAREESFDVESGKWWNPVHDPDLSNQNKNTLKQVVRRLSNQGNKSLRQVVRRMSLNNSYDKLSLPDDINDDAIIKKELGDRSNNYSSPPSFCNFCTCKEFLLLSFTIIMILLLLWLVL